MTLNFALMGIALSLIAIFQCDFFLSRIELLPATCTDCEDSRPLLAVSWGLFRYSGWMFPGEDVVPYLESSTCQMYEGSLFYNQLGVAQSFSIMAPISSLTGCIISIVDLLTSESQNIQVATLPRVQEFLYGMVRNFCSQ